MDMEKTSRFLEAAEDSSASCFRFVKSADLTCARHEDMYQRPDRVLYHNNVHAADAFGLQFIVLLYMTGFVRHGVLRVIGAHLKICLR